MRVCRNKERKKHKEKKRRRATEASDRGNGANGTRLSHFHSQSVVKLASLSEQTVPAQRLLPLNSPFHGCEMEEEVLPLRNMKEHSSRVPLDPSPLHTYCQNIDSGDGSKLHLTLMYQTLCPFELLIVHKGDCAGHENISSRLYKSSEVVPVELICGSWHILAQSAFLEEPGDDKSH